MPGCKDYRDEGGKKGEVREKKERKMKKSAFASGPDPIVCTRSSAMSFS